MQNTLKSNSFMEKRQWIIYIFITIVISFFFIPIHEFGHVIAGRLSGIPMSMSYARDYTLNGQAKNVFEQLGGPVFTVVLAFIGIILIYKRKLLLFAYPFSILMCMDRILVYWSGCFANVNYFLQYKGLFLDSDEGLAAQMLKINPYTFSVIFQGLEVFGIILILISLKYNFEKKLFIMLTPIIVEVPMLCVGIYIIEKNYFPDQYKIQFGGSPYLTWSFFLFAVIISFLLALILILKHFSEFVHGLPAEGKSLQENNRIGIGRFCESSQINRKLPKILMVIPRFSKLLLVFGSAVLVTVIINSSLISKETLTEAEFNLQQPLQQFMKQSPKDYNKIFEQMDVLLPIYKNLSHLSKDLKAKHNTEVIDQISEMNRTFIYGNGLLIMIAIIAADTDYECPYYKDIAELAVMKLSEIGVVVDLVEKAREAKTQEEKKYIEDQIEVMKAGADFKTYQQALDYNSKLSKG